MIELLMATIPYIMTLDIFKEPVQLQEWPSCTIESIYTCSYNKDRDPKAEWEKVSFTTHFNNVISRSKHKWLIKARPVSINNWLAQLRNNERVLLDIWNWDNLDKYTIWKGKNAWHSICWVWTITIKWKERIVAKNTYWEENGIMWYNLIDKKVVKKMSLVLK